jgi:hypothetical protein
MPVLESVLDKHPEAKSDIAMRLAQGKTFAVIAEELSAKYGEQITESAISFFWNKQKEAVKDVPIAVSVDNFDPMAALLSLYKEQLERVTVLRKLEKEVGYPIPETRENLQLLMQIVDKLAGLSAEKKTLTLEDRKRAMLGI